MGSPTSTSLADPHITPSEPAATAVDVRGLTRVFGLAPGIVRVDLQVQRGEVLLVRGPNGAGKSTLLRVLATALSPTYGSGEVLGFDLVAKRSEIRARTEFVGHRTRLYEELTAEENLRFAAALFGVDPSAVPVALDRVGLGRSRSDRVRSYSQGMRQRVALARALLRAPELLLLDEPYAGLDDRAKAIVDDVVADARAKGRTVILATHDPSRLDVGTRVVDMEAGRIVDAPTRPRGS